MKKLFLVGYKIRAYIYLVGAEYTDDIYYVNVWANTDADAEKIVEKHIAARLYRANTDLRPGAWRSRF